MQTSTDAGATAKTGARPRNMIVLRGGDQSLHPTWFTEGVARNWDLHISYFGSKGAPAGAETGRFTWSQDGGRSKWTGLHECLSKNPFNPDDYDYIAAPDDDLVVPTEIWNKAFDISAQYNLAVSQLSLDPRSFYSHGLTLQRSGLLLRFVNVIEYMPPIFRRDVYKRFAKLLGEPDNSWGLEYVVGQPHLAEPRSMAILDAAPLLHTRAPGVSAMYKDLRSGGKSMEEMEQEYLGRHGATKIARTVIGAIDLNGKDVTDLEPVRRPLIKSRLLKEYRRLRKIERIGPTV